jgi:hypothetical protein
VELIEPLLAALTSGGRPEKQLRGRPEPSAGLSGSRSVEGADTVAHDSRWRHRAEDQRPESG